MKIDFKSLNIILVGELPDLGKSLSDVLFRNIEFWDSKVYLYDQTDREEGDVFEKYFFEREKRVILYVTSNFELHEFLKDNIQEDDIYISFSPLKVDLGRKIIVARNYNLASASFIGPSFLELSFYIFNTLQLTQKFRSRQVLGGETKVNQLDNNQSQGNLDEGNLDQKTIERLLKLEREEKNRLIEDKKYLQNKLDQSFSGVMNLSGQMKEVTMKALDNSDINKILQALDIYLALGSKDLVEKDLATIKKSKPSLWQSIQTHAYKIAEKATYDEASKGLIAMIIGGG